MAKYLVLALANVTEGREHEFHDWYDNVAMPVYRGIEGLHHLGRYRILDLPKRHPFQIDSQWQYLSLYEFETDDLAEFSKLADAAIEASPDYHFSEAIDKSTFFEPLFVNI